MMLRRVAEASLSFACEVRHVKILKWDAHVQGRVTFNVSQPKHLILFDEDLSYESLPKDSRYP